MVISLLVNVSSIGIRGADIVEVTVETNVFSRGFPSFDFVGLPGKEVSESKHRVKTALVNSGIDFPAKKILINLAPADIPKDGTFYDLPIAVGLICAFNKVPVPSNSLFFGELSLDGKLRHNPRAFLAGLFCSDKNITHLFVPKSSASLFNDFEGLTVVPVDALTTIIDHLLGSAQIPPAEKIIVQDAYSSNIGSLDFNGIIGQQSAKDALVISAAGNHNVMLKGSPGAGKTLLAKSYRSLLPPLSKVERVEVTKIYSLSGHLEPGTGLITQRPYRSPHHTISYSGMVGGGTNPTPGEISLAHNGVLFMDEFPEFSRKVLESLRQPLEEGYITITRSQCNVKYPSRFTLIASSNPCPCGYFEDPNKSCICSLGQIQNYKKRLSGPLSDRIDIFCNVFPVPTESIGDKVFNDKSDVSGKHIMKQLREKICSTKAIQEVRFKNAPVKSNAHMDTSLIRKYCYLDKSNQFLLNEASEKLNLSVRAYYKVLKVARTIADLEEKDHILEEHLLKALFYRGGD